MKVAIVGATGTLGSELLKYYPDAVAVSRDELKQAYMARVHDKANWVIADIRDPDSLGFLEGCHLVYHVAAMKRVDAVEKFPHEGEKTNLMGVRNVADACIKYRVPYMVLSSTDKAVLPITAYGHQKALAEQYLNNLNRTQDHTRFSIFRWGNVLGSRGSVLHEFARTLKANNSVNITHQDMTRFWILIKDAVNFMVSNYRSTANPHIPEMKAAKVTRLADAVADVLGIGYVNYNMIGLRCVEKIHEVISEENGESTLCSKTSKQYSKRELRELVAEVLGQ
jgi:UDP-N-acetylglucosamine 4,6-dehydratase